MPDAAKCIAFTETTSRTDITIALIAAGIVAAVAWSAFWLWVGYRLAAWMNRVADAIADDGLDLDEYEQLRRVTNGK